MAKTFLPKMESKSGPQKQKQQRYLSSALCATLPLKNGEQRHEVQLCVPLLHINTHMASYRFVVLLPWQQVPDLIQAG